MSGWRKAGHFSFDPPQNAINTKKEKLSYFWLG